MGSRSAISEVSKNDLQAVINESSSYKEVLHTLGYISTAGRYTTLYKRIARDNLDVTTLQENKQRQRITWKIVPEKEFFAKNSLYPRSRIKRRILKDNLIPYECSVCGNDGVWNGKKLVLQLEHINGVNNDHRLKNLTFLCPNCHTQTDTYAGKKVPDRPETPCQSCDMILSEGNIFCTVCMRSDRSEKPRNTCQGCGEIVFKTSTFCNTCMGSNNRRTTRPSREQLYEDLVELHYIGTGKKYGVTDNAIRKWCDALDLPRRVVDLEKFVL